MGALVGLGVGFVEELADVVVGVGNEQLFSSHLARYITPLVHEYFSATTMLPA